MKPEEKARLADTKPGPDEPGAGMGLAVREFPLRADIPITFSL